MVRHVRSGIPCARWAIRLAMSSQLACLLSCIVLGSTTCPSAAGSAATPPPARKGASWLGLGFVHGIPSRIVIPQGFQVAGPALPRRMMNRVKMTFFQDDCDGMPCPVDCVDEILCADALRDLTENAGSWKVTISPTGQLKEEGPKLVVVQVYARNSIASALVREKFSAACSKFGENKKDVLFVKVPMDARSEELREWAREQGVKKLPTFILFKGGRRIDHFHGRDVYRGQFSQYIADNTNG